MHQGILMHINFWIKKNKIKNIKIFKKKETKKICILDAFIGLVLKKRLKNDLNFESLEVSREVEQSATSLATIHFITNTIPKYTFSQNNGVANDLIQ